MYITSVKLIGKKIFIFLLLVILNIIHIKLREKLTLLLTLLYIVYNILYYNREMLHDGSIGCAQAGGPYQASRRPCFSPGMHCRASRVLEGGINMQDRLTQSTTKPSWKRSTPAHTALDPSGSGSKREW